MRLAVTRESQLHPLTVRTTLNWTISSLRMPLIQRNKHKFWLNLTGASKSHSSIILGGSQVHSSVPAIFCYLPPYLNAVHQRHLPCARAYARTHTHTPIIYNYLPIQGYITTAVEEEALNELKIKYSLLVAEHGHSTPQIIWQTRSPFYPPPIRKTYPLTYMYIYVILQSPSWSWKCMFSKTAKMNSIHVRCLPVVANRHLVH